MAKAIMIQGTMSNAGKSLVAAGLCRIFYQDGFQVAPFKSQNMALNSWITKEGLEMGRAQVVQAEAACTEPVAAMNPVLLKPSSNTGSQVIVNGVPVGNMPASVYYQYKKQLIPEIKKAYDLLAANYDIIVIEGAGSPAEINLKENDIVNMGVARMADAPVLLVGDIDRGGVFAQLYGTVALLEPEERARVKGLVINKFRGDKSLLESGLGQLYQLVSIPVTGVIPWVDVDIEDEDSLGGHLEGNKRKALLDAAVIRFPKISNFTDFQAMAAHPCFQVRYVSSVRELGNPDLIVLPGTKNTAEDLLWMRQNGLEAEIQKAAASNKTIFGICGGFQMLGEWIEDPKEVESSLAVNGLRGLGLLPVRTVFGQEKVRTRVSGAFGTVGGILWGLSGLKLEGYEIHMGETVRSVPPLSFVMESQSDSHLAKMDGCQKGNVYGTYIHGIFDGDGICDALSQALLREKGLSPQEKASVSYKDYREAQYNKLADAVRQNLDMTAVYEMMGIDQKEIGKR